MEFLGNLGVDVWLLVAQIVNFLFLLWILNKFVYKPILNRIEKDEAVLKHVEEAQLLLTEQEKRLVLKEKQYTTRTKNKAKAIIGEAQEIADTLRETARTEAEQEKEAVIAQVHKRLAEISHDNS